MDGKFDLGKLKLSAFRRGISEVDVEAVTKRFLSPKQAIVELRGFGLSCVEIGKFYGLSRQRIDQIIGPQSKSQKFATRPVVRGNKPSEAVALEIWTEAAHELSWWGVRSGRLLKKKMVAKFRSYDYTYPASRELAAKYSISKLETILQVMYGVEPTREAVQAWLLSRNENGLDRTDILDLINSTQELKVPVLTFMATWRRLGLKIDKRRTTKQMATFREGLIK